MTANITAMADASASALNRAVDWLRQGAATSAFAAASAAAAATAAAAASAPTSDAAASAPAAAATAASAAEAAAAVAATTASAAAASAAAASVAEAAPAWVTLIWGIKQKNSGELLITSIFLDRNVYEINVGGFNQPQGRKTTKRKKTDQASRTKSNCKFKLEIYSDKTREVGEYKSPLDFNITVNPLLCSSNRGI